MSSARIVLSYSDDEVRAFHPHVEDAIKDYIAANKLSGQYEVIHHPVGTTGSIPDFVIVDKVTGKWLFVVEVKRTPSSVESFRIWDQARSYVVNNKSARWASGKKLYFMVTNLELSYLLSDRSGESAQFCLLKNGEMDCGLFGGDARGVIEKFRKEVVPKIFELVQIQREDFSDHLKLILESFVALEDGLTTHISKEIHKKDVKKDPKRFGFKDLKDYNTTLDNWRNVNDPRAEKLDVDKVCRDIARDGLFRIFFYEYCREYLHSLKLFTSLKPIRYKSRSDMEKSVRLSLEDLNNIDFSQIIESRLIKFIPENIDSRTYDILNTLLEKLRSNISEAVQESGSPTHLLNLITQNQDLYPWKEVNGDGKVMTDMELADMVTSLCFTRLEDNGPPKSYDPGCGTGNLSLSVYDHIRSKYPSLSHNQVLSYISGCEVDRFLGKLAVLSLTLRSPKEVSKKTEVDIELKDFFESEKSRLKKYDLIVMNPPFLRNDNKVAPLKAERIEEKIAEMLGTSSEMVAAKQPNLFFFFVEVATRFLREKGVAGYFLMSSFLNSENGVHLKRFLLNNFEIDYVILVPRVFFKGYQVSPCIFIGRRSDKPSPENEVRFVRVIDPSFFNTRYDDIREEETRGILNVNKRLQGSLTPEEDWRQFLVPMPSFYNTLKESAAFVSLDDVFGGKLRGLGGEGSGGKFFFPWSNGDVVQKLGQVVGDIPARFRSLGINNSDIPTGYTFTEQDLRRQMCLSIPASVRLSSEPELRSFINRFKSKYILPKKWNIDGFPSAAQIIIPRASRKIHSVFFNPLYEREEVYYSTNFGGFWDCKLEISGVSEQDAIKYLVAFLNSSFGQIFFELESQNREGLRKIEMEPMKNKILVPANGLDNHVQEVRDIIGEFDRLPFGMTGLEELESNPRIQLDRAIAKLLFAIEPALRPLFASPEEFATAAEAALRNLVRDRKEI